MAGSCCSTPSDPKTSEDLWILPLDTLKPFVFLKTEFREKYAQFSPDGRWIAYIANPSGDSQVYVRPFVHEREGQETSAATAASGPQWMVSTTAGPCPRWSGDGKRLFFVGLSGDFMVADVQPGATFQSGTPRRLFGGVMEMSTSVAPFGSTLAGDRFLFMDYSTPGPPPPFTVVLNWYTRLKN